MSSHRNQSLGQKASNSKERKQFSRQKTFRYGTEYTQT